MARSKLLLVGAVCLLLIAAWQLGWFSLVADPARLREAILALGPWGYVVFLAGFIFISPFGLPGILFVLAAAYIWPRPLAYGLSVAGAVGGSAVGFAFARFIARDWVSGKLPPKIKQYDPWIEKRGWIAAAVLRAIFLMHPLLHAAFGLSKIRFVPYIAGSTLGYLPSLAVVVWASGSAIDALRDQPPEIFLIGIGALVFVVIAVRLTRRWLKQRRGSALPADHLQSKLGNQRSSSENSQGKAASTCAPTAPP